jgi:hypothetical protein
VVLHLEVPLKAVHLGQALTELTFGIPAVDRIGQDLTRDLDALNFFVRPGAIASRGLSKQRADPTTTDLDRNRDMGKHG